MKPTFLNSLPACMLGKLLAAAMMVSAAQGQNPLPMRDAATHEQLVLKLREVSQQNPMAKFESVEGEDPSKVNRPESLLANSDIVCFDGKAVLVPKRAILQTPPKLANRIGMQPGAGFASWADFYAANRGWITTVEVRRAQAEGKEPVEEMSMDHIKKSANLIIAVYLGGPISVLPPAAPVTEITSNTKTP